MMCYNYSAVRYSPRFSRIFCFPLLTNTIVGVAGDFNSTGDEQKKLDVLSNEMFVNSLYNSHACAILVSEENEDPIIVPEHMAGTNCAFCVCAFFTACCLSFFGISCGTMQKLFGLRIHWYYSGGFILYLLLGTYPLFASSLSPHASPPPSQASTAWPSIPSTDPPTLTAMCPPAPSLPCGRRYVLLFVCSFSLVRAAVFYHLIEYLSVTR